MFAKIFALLALIAVALAAPKPAPAPAPQYLAYSGLDYAYPAVAAPVANPFAAAPVAYSAYNTYPAGAGAYYVR